MSLLLDALNKVEKNKLNNVPTLDATHSTTIANKTQLFSNSRNIFFGIIALTILATGSVAWYKYAKTSSKAVPQVTHKEAIQLPAQPKVNISSVQSSVSASVSSATSEAQTSDTNENTDNEIENLYKSKETPAPNTSLVITNNLQKDGTADRLANYANIPDLHDLPQEFLNKIPSLNYSEHHYSEHGASVVINGQVKHVQDLLSAGVTIEKIVEDGLILHGDIYTFKMSALNSWVNM